jgi:quercetin dioxygenase-like cupin family protein
MSVPPLPPRAPDMNIAKIEHFSFLKDATFEKPPSGNGLETRDLGFAKISGGQVGVAVVRASGESCEPTLWHMHNLELQVGYIVKGWMKYEVDGLGEVTVEAGTGIYHVPRTRMRMLACSPDFEGIWVKMPPQDTVTLFIPDEDTQEYEAVEFENSLS